MSKSKAQLQEQQRKAQAAQRQQFMAIGVVVVVVVVLFGILIAFINQAGSPIVPGKYDDLYKTTTSDGLPIAGDAKTQFTVMEFTDFGCPYCLAYKPTLNEIISKLVAPGTVRLVMAPQNFHPNSEVATAAALCAGKQGKFWEMQDELFAIQASQGTAGFNINTLKQAAQSLKLDVNSWLNCVTGTTTDQTATNSARLYANSGQPGTPTLVWSTDGKTWQLFRDNQGNTINGGGVPVEVIRAQADAYYQANPS